MTNNYRTSSEFYHISSIKLLQITEQVRGIVTGQQDEQIRDYILADWPEGEDHQNWIDTAPVNEIAGWVIEGLHGVELD